MVWCVYNKKLYKLDHDNILPLNELFSKTSEHSMRFCIKITLESLIEIEWPSLTHKLPISSNSSSIEVSAMFDFRQYKFQN